MLHLFFYMHQMQKSLEEYMLSVGYYANHLKFFINIMFLFIINLFSKHTKRIFNIKTLKIVKMLL